MSKNHTLNNYIIGKKDMHAWCITLYNIIINLGHRHRGFCRCTCSVALPASISPEIGRHLSLCHYRCTPQTSDVICARHGQLCSAPTKRRLAGVHRRQALLFLIKKRKSIITCLVLLATNTVLTSAGTFSVSFSPASLRSFVSFSLRKLFITTLSMVCPARERADSAHPPASPRYRNRFSYGRMTFGNA
ncbi:hypothetical protein AGLY_012751 [Aphis glycines]|uniref:Uncharacterized protein n=1 Tax=Aphis glycines TaxID=307491 RepID=A0A6G0T808_APHGL|nr:hypothetical protein AGLY_012751 [Aphis glycines]